MTEEVITGMPNELVYILFLYQIVLERHALLYLYRMTLDFTSSVHIVSVILCSSLQRVTKNTRLHRHLHGGNGQTLARDDGCTHH